MVVWTLLGAGEAGFSPVGGEAGGVARVVRMCVASRLRCLSRRGTRSIFFSKGGSSRSIPGGTLFLPLARF